MATKLTKCFFVKNATLVKFMKGRHFVFLAKKNPVASEVSPLLQKYALEKFHTLKSRPLTGDLPLKKERRILSKTLKRSSSSPNITTRTISQSSRTKSAVNITQGLHNYTNQFQCAFSSSSQGPDKLNDGPASICATAPCQCPWPGGCPPPGFTQTGNPCMGGAPCMGACPQCGPCGCGPMPSPMPQQFNPCPMCGACGPMAPCGACGACGPWGPSQCGPPQSCMGGPCFSPPCQFPCPCSPNQQQQPQQFGQPMTMDEKKKK